MTTSIIKPNHRVLIVDDNPAIHEDFRKIFCPMGADKSEVQGLKAALFDHAPKVIPHFVLCRMAGDSSWFSFEEQPSDTA
jgi:hypothetical protein